MLINSNNKDFLIRELQQEHLLSNNIMKHLEEHDIISQEVFGALSHELQTPVVTIKAYIDMLLNGHFGELNSEQKEKIERVKENTDFLINIICEMLKKVRN